MESLLFHDLYYFSSSYPIFCCDWHYFFFNEFYYIYCYTTIITIQWYYFFKKQIVSLLLKLRLFTNTVIWNFKIQIFFLKRRKELQNHLKYICQEFYVWIFIQSNLRGKVILMFLIHLYLNHQIAVFLKAIWCSTSFWIL